MLVPNAASRRSLALMPPPTITLSGALAMRSMRRLNAPTASESIRLLMRSDVVSAGLSHGRNVLIVAV